MLFCDTEQHIPRQDLLSRNGTAAYAPLAAAGPDSLF
jgi:hypothetical protein